MTAVLNKFAVLLKMTKPIHDTALSLSPTFARRTVVLVIESIQVAGISRHFVLSFHVSAMENPRV
jgi:hypothetical protein